jgi:hypothetical protein
MVYSPVDRHGGMPKTTEERNTNTVHLSSHCVTFGHLSKVELA